jgi:hypothetical protein
MALLLLQKQNQNLQKTPLIFPKSVSSNMPLNSLLKLYKDLLFQYAIKFFVEIIQGFASYNEASVLKWTQGM